MTPRLGFLGLGWIGRSRMEAILADGTATVAALADTSAEAMHSCLGLASQATMAGGLDELLELKLDGIVIATPSALHAWQAQAALNSGTAVFCQKPLGRSAEETAMVVDAARRADRLLGVDFSYRDTRALAALHELICSGELGDIYAADLTFHNAYGPDKPWFHEPSLAGGGCVMDLGIHLVDLALWMFGKTAVETVTSRLFSKGRPLPANSGVIEDFAVAQLGLVEGQVVRLACSWNLPAGCDAVIEATFYGTAGGACFRNVGGSFFDFTAERFDGTRRTTLVSPPDSWSGRTAAAWARRLAADRSFDPSIEEATAVATVLDRIYGR